MFDDAPTDPAQFADAIAAFRNLVPMADDEYDALAEELRESAFTVAGVAELDLVTEVWTALDDAVANGTTLEDFQAAVSEHLADAWGGDNPWRVETIFRTNVMRAYAAGRYAQMTDPDVIAERPYWMYDAILDKATTDVCKACDGKVVAADDAWWDGHYPPCHFNCRSVVTTLDEDEAKERGITASPPLVKADEGFGIPPARPRWEPRKDDYPQPLWNEFEEKPDDDNEEAAE